MSDVFKILLNNKKTRSQKSLDERTRSILNKQESEYYSNNEDFLDDDEFDIDIGIEKDVANHMQDLEKISFRELDKKPSKDQLKILKTEYQRVYDKANHLNNLLISSENTNSNFLIEKRQHEKSIKEIRRTLRTIAFALPGSSELKKAIEKGTWAAKDVEPLFIETIQTILSKLSRIDVLVEEQTESIRKENLELKEKILVYRKALDRIEELEEIIISLQGQSGISQRINERPHIKTEPIQENTPTDAKYEHIELEEDKANNNDTETDSEEENELHFKDFYNRFQDSYGKLKKDNLNSPKKEEPEQVNKEVVKKEPVKEDLPKNVDTRDDLKSRFTEKDPYHPLSPDFVETEKESVSEIFDGNLDEYLNNLSDNQEFILGIIGKTGLSRNPDLRDYLTEHDEGSKIYVKGRRFDYQALSYDVSNLRDKGILNDGKLSIGGSAGSSNMIVFELSEIGKQCFKSLFKDDPVVSEMKRIKGPHASLEHGYLIKDSAKIFREMGYKVLTELSDVTHKIDSSTRKVFDFLAVDKSGKTLHIEVERGTHTKEDFFYALDKIYQITKDFYFITPNETVKNKKTKQMFFAWVTERLGGVQKADVVLNITTIDTLRKKPKNIWETTDLRNFNK